MTVAGGGAAASIAGCLGFGDDEGTDALEGDPDDELGDVDDTDDDTVDQTDEEAEPEDVEGVATAAVEPDQQEMFELQMEIQQQVEEGELTEEEAQQEIQEAQAELVEEANETFLDRIDDEPDVTVEDSLEDVGAFLLDGEAEPILGLLNHEEVSALLSAQTFAEAAAQQP